MKSLESFQNRFKDRFAFPVASCELEWRLEEAATSGFWKRCGTWQVSGNEDSSHQHVLGQNRTSNKEASFSLFSSESKVQPCW